MAEPIEVVSELTVVDQPSSEIVEADPGKVVAAFQNYMEIQKALDNTLPNCIQQIQGKPFRKKVYWRAIATAFNLRLDLVSESREEIQGDWGYLVTYRATAGNGRSCDGDGSCFVSEKSGAMATVHNVRAHAHTRAKNRAISDLVGFGEVSAEEVNQAPAQRETKAKQNDRASELTTAVKTRAAELVALAAEEKNDKAPQDEGAMEIAIRDTVMEFLQIKGNPKASQTDALLAAIGSSTLTPAGGVFVPGPSSVF